MSPSRLRGETKGEGRNTEGSGEAGEEVGHIPGGVMVNLHCQLDWIENHHGDISVGYVYESTSKKIELGKGDPSQMWAAPCRGLGTWAE